jgi:hypothetical protein
LSLVLERTGDVDTRKSVHMHLNYDLLSEILKDVAKTVPKLPQVDVEHRKSLSESVTVLQRALSKDPKIPSAAQ